MMKLLCASTVVALAGAAQASTFQTNIIDAGTINGSVGAPITWTGGTTSFQSSASRVAPSADDIDGNAKLQWDNYFGMDPLTQSSGGDPSTKGDGYTSNAALTIVDPPSGSPSGFGAGTAFGVWGSTSFVNSGNTNFGGKDSLFIMNLTLRSSAGPLDTAGVVIQIQDGATSVGGVFATIKFGSANAATAPGLTGSYYLDFIKTTVTTAQTNATFNGGTNYQVFIVQAIPTPGAAGLAGLAGLVSLRRRRA